MDKEAIKKIIPHRDPFLLIDEITELVPGKSAKGNKTLTGEEDFFRGHFPGNPVMPGVLMVEAMAQIGAVAVLSLEDYNGKTAYFTKIQNARFRKMVYPGDKLEMSIELVGMRMGIGQGKAEAKVNGVLVASAEISFAIG